ncbi:hypothetical protein H6P81_020268 [Aristolochia fimbriata]|uniref:Uncharacterized protein n=1 Tax=Aristolochia fimbriata TaxID=158543 RepID=A0AAV7DYH5_ARIFI|nr:hypothetical protein H6P81_020268 [Aristolochia fimbriata]
MAVLPTSSLEFGTVEASDSGRTRWHLGARKMIRNTDTRYVVDSRFRIRGLSRLGGHRCKTLF